MTSKTRKYAGLSNLGEFADEFRPNSASAGSRDAEVKSEGEGALREQTAEPHAHTVDTPASATPPMDQQAVESGPARTPPPRDPYPGLAIRPREEGNPYDSMNRPWPWFAADRSGQTKVVNFRFPVDLQSKLEVAARRLGLSKTEFVTRVLEERLREILKNEGIPYE